MIFCRMINQERLNALSFIFVALKISLLLKLSFDATLYTVVEIDHG
jgi:hypothetical protein